MQNVLWSYLSAVVIPVMPFKLIIFRYDCIIANFAKGLSWISRIWVISRPGFSGRAGFRAGFGLKVVQMFCPDFGPAYKIFYNIQNNDFFFRDLHYCGDFSAWSECDFSSANSIYKRSCVLSFSAWVRLTILLRRRRQWGH